MTVLVRHANNIGQEPCTPKAVENPWIDVHAAYMGTKPKRAKKKFAPHQLRRWRLKRNLSTTALATRAGCSHASIVRIEKNEQALGQPLLDHLAIALRTTRGKILDEPPDDTD